VKDDTTVAPSRASFGPRTMTPQEILAFFARRQQAYDSLDAAQLAVDYTIDCRLESPTAGVITGRAGIEKVYRAWFDAFLDLKTTSTSLVVDGPRVAQVLEVEGTDIGGFMGLPATGRRFHMSVVCIYEFRDRLIARERRIYDFTGVLIQLGVLKTKPI
jgi:predicted ester cyclase